MSWNLFGKDIYDEDLCFCRDFVEIITPVSQVTTSLVWQTAGRKILAERNLQSKMNEYYHLSSRDKVHDCYPSDRQKLLANAESIMQFVNSIGLSQSQLINLRIMNVVSSVLKKMRFQDAEKTYLIRNYILHKDLVNKPLEDVLLDRWKETIF